MQASGWLGLQWGDVPAWVGSILTGVALLIAANTYRKSVLESTRTQASMVTVWVERTDGVETVHVKNGSNASVYAVTVYYGGKHRSEDTSPYYGVRYKDSGLKELGKWPSIGPNEIKSAALKRDFFSDPEIPWLYFRDANGVDWIRDYRARLERHNYRQQQQWSESWYLGKRSRGFDALPNVWLILYLIKEVGKSFCNRVQRIFTRRADPAITSEDEQQGP